MGGNLRSSRFRLYAYPFNGPRVDLSSLVTSWTVSRGLGPDGPFTATLVPRLPLARQDLVGAWFRLEAQVGRTQEYRNLIWGRLASPRRTVTTDAAGARRRSIPLAGRDHTSVLTDLQVYFNPFLSMKAREQGIETPGVPILDDDVVDGLEIALREAIAGHPGTYVSVLYDIFLRRGVGSSQLFEVPVCLLEDAARYGAFLNSLRAYPLMPLVLGPVAQDLRSPGLKGVFFDQSLLMTLEGGRFWDYLTRYSNPAVNELFGRLDARGLPEIVLRERPFPCYGRAPGVPATRHGRGRRPDSAEHTVRLTQQWEDLPGTAVHARWLANADLGFGDAERVNYLMLFAEGTPLTHQDQVYLLGESFLRGAPVVDFESVQRHGLRRLEPQTLYTGYDAKGAGERWVEPASIWLAQLWAWYSINHALEGGTLVLPYLERVEVGERFWVKAEDGTWDEYYVEGVAWSWKMDASGAPSSSTSLKVTRGVSGILGTLRRTQDGRDRLEWDVPGAYPIPLPAKDDVEALLDAASHVDASWTDAGALQTVLRALEFETAGMMYQSPEESALTDPLALARSLEEIPDPALVNASPPEFTFDVDRRTLHPELTQYNEDTAVRSPVQVEGAVRGQGTETPSRPVDVASLEAVLDDAVPTPDPDETFEEYLARAAPPEGWGFSEAVLNNLRPETAEDRARDDGHRTGEVPLAARPNLIPTLRTLQWFQGQYGIPVGPFAGYNTSGVNHESGSAIDLRVPSAPRGLLILENVLLSLFRSDSRGLGLQVGLHQFNNGSHMNLIHLEVHSPRVSFYFWRYTATDPGEGHHGPHVEFSRTQNTPTFVSELDRLVSLDPEFGGELGTADLTLEDYQAFLNQNGITAEIATARTLTFLRDAAKVRALAEAGEPGYFWRSDDDRTLFALPPRVYWYNILPPLLILKGTLDAEALDAVSSGGDPQFTAGDFEIYDAYRPPDYDQLGGGGPDSMHRFNHAVKIRLQGRAVDHTLPDDPLATLAGESLWGALRLAPAGLLERYGAFVRLYEEPAATDVRRYRTHIDAGFYADVAPDGTHVDTSATHDRGGRGAGLTTLESA